MVNHLTEHHCLERRLLLSDATARTVLDSSPVPCMMNRPASFITNVNDRFVELSGFTRAELVGRTVAQLEMLVDDSDSRTLLDIFAVQGRVDGVEFNFRRKDSVVRRAMVSTTRVKVDETEQYLHSFVDLTVQRDALDQARLARKAFVSISQGLLVCDAQRLTLSANPAFERITGYTQSELMGQTTSNLQGKNTNPVTVAAMRAALDAGESFQGELLNYCKDGTPFWNEMTINPVPDAKGRVTHFIGIVQDVTGRRQQEAQRRIAEQVFEQSREGIVVTDAKRQIVMVNAAFSAITGYSEAEVLGRNPHMLSSGRHDRSFYRRIWRDIHARGVWQGELWNRRRDGQDFLEWLTIKVLRDATGAVTHYTGTFTDLTDQRAAQERIDWLSHFDPLTRLPNRDLLADRCDHDINVAKRDGKSVAMLALNLDRFRQINETLGFSIGNRILKKFSARLARAVRDKDTVARLQGDEFVVVLPSESPEGASALAHRLLTILAEPYGVADTEARTGTSIGIAMYPSDGTDFEALFKAARVAMYQCKAEGGQQHRFFSAELFEATIAKQALVSALRKAIDNKQLRLHYQPFVDLRTGRIGGMEALLRWQHPEMGAVSPGTFIPLAEESGHIVAIGIWVLRQACRDINAWQDSGLDVPPVSVNLSPVQFRDPELLNTVRSVLQEHAIAPRQICLELTEGAVMDDAGHSERVLRALKELGVRLSLDDFGTGYSSLSYLKRFPFDKVKIDQSFVRDIHSSTQDAVIAKVVISMSHGLGLRVIAEGVETEAQCKFMQHNACDEIQGFLFSKPVPADQLQALLREDRRLPAHLVCAPPRLPSTSDSV